MTIRRLRTLVAIADAKTFSAAADIVHVTHAAVSQQMQSLEADFDIVLFNRDKRTPQLTPTARMIVEKARSLIADYDNLVPSVIGDGGLSGTISLGVLRTTLTGMAPLAMAELKAKFPDIRLNVRPGLTSTLLAEVERGHLDAAIVTKPPLLPKDVSFIELAQERMHLIASQRETETDPMVLIRDRPFIRFDRTAVVGAMIDDWLATARIHVHETMELDSLEAIAGMVQADLGVSIVPDTAVMPVQIAPMKHFALGDSAPIRILGLAARNDSIKTLALQEVENALKRVIKAGQTQKPKT